MSDQSPDTSDPAAVPGERPAFLAGAGAGQVREAQALLARAAVAMPDMDTIAASVAFEAGDGRSTRPAVPSTPARLVARTLETMSGPAAAPQRRSLRSSAPERAADDGIADRLRALSAAMVDAARDAGGALQQSATPISRTASFNFTEYCYLRDVDVLAGAGDPRMTHTVAAFIDKARTIITDVVDVYAPRNALSPGVRPRQRLYPPRFDRSIAASVQLFTANAAVGLYELAALIRPGYRGASGDTTADVLGAMREWFIPLVRTASGDGMAEEFSFARPEAWLTSEQEIRGRFFEMHPGAQWGSVVAPQPTGYPFTLFPPGLVNFGLQLVYRHDWRPLGTQAGEIVRTIPLAPKQVEHISTETVVTESLSRTEDTTTSTESASETDVTHRDASEVVKEASRSFNWHTEAKGGFSLGPFSASVSGGMEGERSSSSKDTKSQINESVARTATKTSRTVNVVVSSERTSSETLSRSSEIVNHNDDATLTYVYSKLLRQYEIQTHLAEVVSVVFVPEYVPQYDEIDERWVRRHDWIIRDALLDGSFAEDLEAVSRDVPLSPISAEEHDTARAGAVAAHSAMGGFNVLPGRLPDIFGTPQLNYHDLTGQARTLTDANTRHLQRRERLLDHIRQNILHYMRAIWGREDAEQRQRRYAQIFVPTTFTFVPDSVGPVPPGDVAPGRFEPVYDADSMRRLTDVIHAAGPLTHCANYAVFLLRRDPSLVDLNGALSTLRAGYVGYAVDVHTTASVPAIAAWVASPRHTSAIYTLHAGPTAGGWTVDVELPDGTAWSTAAALDQAHVLATFDGCCVQFAQMPAAGSEYRVTVAATDELEDPELRALRSDRPLPLAADEDAVLSAILDDMIDTMPEVARGISASQAADGFGQLTPDQQALVRANYHPFLLRREHTRHFLMDTNNLVVDVEVGATSILENYKRLHRAIDVLKEVEALSTRRLDNLRRDALVAAGSLSDPEIETLTVVQGAAAIEPTVPVTPPPAPPGP